MFLPAGALSINCVSMLFLMQTCKGAAYAGKDIIGLAQTGSGKTGAFALPILQVRLHCGLSEGKRLLSPDTCHSPGIAGQPWCTQAICALLLSATMVR